MNKEYGEVAGKLIISDETGHLRIEDATESSIELLKQENREKREKQTLDQFRSEKLDYYRYKDKYVPIWLYGTFASVLLAPPLAIAMAGVNPITSNFDTIFGTVNQTLLLQGITGAILIPFGGIITYLDYKRYKNNREKWKHATDQYDIHLKRWEIENERLAELEEQTSQEKNKEYVKTLRVKKVIE